MQNDSIEGLGDLANAGARIKKASQAAQGSRQFEHSVLMALMHLHAAVVEEHERLAAIERAVGLHTVR